MTDKELNICLREIARQNGLCDEWYEKWSDESTLDECCRRLVLGFDFACDKDYPTLSFCRQNFLERRDILHKHNIYIDEEINIINAKSGTYIFYGECSGVITFRGNSIGNINLRHKSDIDVFSFENAHVFISLYDSSKVSYEENEYSKLKVFDRRNN